MTKNWYTPKVIAAIMCVLSLSTPLMACSQTQEAVINESTDASLKDMTFEVYIPNLAQNASPMMIRCYHGDEMLNTVLTIEPKDIVDNKFEASIPKETDSIDIVTPVNPDGSTYEFDVPITVSEDQRAIIIKATLQREGNVTLEE